MWNILPNNIKKGRWCPICNMGFNEKVVYDYLINMHCNFEIQYSFDDLMGDNNEKLRFDFAILNSDNSLVYLIEVEIIILVIHQDKFKDKKQYNEIFRKMNIVRNIIFHFIVWKFLSDVLKSGAMKIITDISTQS